MICSRLHRSEGLTGGCILGFWPRGLCLKGWPHVTAVRPRSPGQGRALGFQ